jgi:hypothetical protein
MGQKNTAGTLTSVSGLSRPLELGHDARKDLMNRYDTANRPPPLVSLFRGLYTRVARQLGVDTSYVSRVARDERKSDAVTAALSEETRKILELTANHNGNHTRGISMVAAKKQNANKEEADLTAVSVKKEMAQPRLAKSARNGETNHPVTKRAKKVA